MLDVKKHLIHLLCSVQHTLQTTHCHSPPDVSTAWKLKCVSRYIMFKVQHFPYLIQSSFPPFFLHEYNETEDNIKYKSKFVTLEYSNILQTSVKQERIEWKQYVITLQH
jgi:hypothetical protein